MKNILTLFVMVTASHQIAFAEQEGYVSVRATGGFSPWTLHSEGTVKGRKSECSAFTKD
jgi:hypothetical protein